MKFGVREIANVVLRAKAAMKIGNKVFYKNEPVVYFDSLKTSTMEGASTTVYAQGGRGNARLVAWEGERTVTFTMEDALISPEGFSILTGAGLISADEDHKIIVHTTERTNNIEVTASGTGENRVVSSVAITLKETPYLGKGVQTSENSNSITYLNDSEDFIYVMLLDDSGEVVSEPFIASEAKYTNSKGEPQIYIYADETSEVGSDINHARKNDLSDFNENSTVLVDYYVAHDSGAWQVDISPESFGGNFYLEAETLFRDTNGVDMPAEFIIPNCKVQSNFTFTMAATGDPSTFTFTMDAFPDYTRWNKNKKVFAAIQVIDTSKENREMERLGTAHDNAGVADTYNTEQKPYIDEIYGE